MNQLLFDINEIFSKFSIFDKKTIKKANRVKSDIVKIIAYYENRELSQVENKTKKKIICIEMLGYIPYNFRLLTFEFLVWMYVNQDKKFNYNLMYLQCEYENFINAVGYEPKNFNDFERWCNLDSEKQTEIMNVKYK